MDLLEKLYSAVFGSGRKGSPHSTRQVESTDHDDNETSKHEKDLYHISPNNCFYATNWSINCTNASNDENGGGHAQTGHRF